MINNEQIKKIIESNANELNKNILLENQLQMPNLTSVETKPPKKINKKKKLKKVQKPDQEQISNILENSIENSNEYNQNNSIIDLTSRRRESINNNNNIPNMNQLINPNMVFNFNNNNNKNMNMTNMTNNNNNTSNKIIKKTLKKI